MLACNDSIRSHGADGAPDQVKRFALAAALEHIPDLRDLTTGNFDTCLARTLSETFAYLDIDDVRGEAAERIFSGWMMASSPALNPLEHPVYDVWVINCTIISADVSGDRR